MILLFYDSAVFHHFDASSCVARSAQKGETEKEGTQDYALSCGTAKVGATVLMFQECTWWLSQ